MVSVIEGEFQSLGLYIVRKSKNLAEETDADGYGC